MDSRRQKKKHTVADVDKVVGHKPRHSMISLLGPKGKEELDHYARMFAAVEKRHSVASARRCLHHALEREKHDLENGHEPSGGSFLSTLQDALKTASSLARPVSNIVGHGVDIARQIRSAVKGGMALGGSAVSHEEEGGLALGGAEGGLALGGAWDLSSIFEKAKGFVGRAAQAAEHAASVAERLAPHVQTAQGLAASAGLHGVAEKLGRAHALGETGSRHARRAASMAQRFA